MSLVSISVLHQLGSLLKGTKLATHHQYPAVSEKYTSTTITMYKEAPNKDYIIYITALIYCSKEPKRSIKLLLLGIKSDLMVLFLTFRQ